MGIAKGDFLECKKLAQSFLATAEWCVGDGFNDVLKNKYPLIVNAAFSCEAFMKAIMIYDSDKGEFSTGHNLKMLFGELDSNVRNWITQKFSEKFASMTVDQLLEYEQNDFEKWRYAFENRKSKLTSNALGLINFARSLNEYVSALEVTE